MWKSKQPMHQRTAKKSLRVMVIPTREGLKEVDPNDSREATLVGKIWVAVHRYLETGDDSALRKIRRETILDANGKRIRFTKDLAELDRLASAGVLSFESIYAKVG